MELRLGEREVLIGEDTLLEEGQVVMVDGQKYKLVIPEDGVFHLLFLDIDDTVTRILEYRN